MLRDTSHSPRAPLERALRASIAVQGDATHPLGCMLTLSAPISPETGEGVQSLAAAGRAVTRAALRDCLLEGVEAGELHRDADLEGLVVLYDGFRLGVSTQVRDGVPQAAIEAAVGCAMMAWDACGAKR